MDSESYEVPLETADMINEAKEKKKRRQEIEESSGDYKLIKQKEYNIQEDEEINQEVGLATSVGNAIVSGLIKIPYGFANLGAMIMDLAADENLPVDQSNVARLDRWFEQTYLGNILLF